MVKKSARSYTKRTGRKIKTSSGSAVRKHGRRFRNGTVRPVPETGERPVIKPRGKK